MGRQTDRLDSLSFEDAPPNVLGRADRRDPPPVFTSRSRASNQDRCFHDIQRGGFPRPVSFELRHARSDRAPAGDVPPEGGNSVLLVVEDDPDDYLLLERAFRKVSATVALHWAQTGAEALAALRDLESQARLVCVVADVQLPRMDGFDLLRQIRTRGSQAIIRFVFLTGRRDRSTQEQARESGADAFFVKPNGIAELVEIARAIAQLAHATAP